MKGGLYLDEQYGNGSCFVVELPGGLSSDIPKVLRKKSFSKTWNSLTAFFPRSLRVLLVDDSLTSSRLLQRRLEMALGPLHSLVVQTALTGEEALSILSPSSGDSNFDVVVIDQNMHSAGGELLGHEVVRQIRGRLNLQRTVVIGCTGNAANCRTVRNYANRCIFNISKRFLSLSAEFFKRWSK